jgi:hypothetical protein
MNVKWQGKAFFSEEKNQKTFADRRGHARSGLPPTA